MLKPDDRISMNGSNADWHQRTKFGRINYEYETGQYHPHRLCGDHAEIIYRLRDERYHFQSAAGCT